MMKLRFGDMKKVSMALLVLLLLTAGVSQAAAAFNGSLAAVGQESDAEALKIFKDYKKWLNVEYLSIKESYGETEGGVAYCLVRISGYDNPVLLAAEGAYADDDGVSLIFTKDTQAARDGSETAYGLLSKVLPLKKMVYWDGEVHELSLDAETAAYYQTMCGYLSIGFYDFRYKQAREMMENGRLGVIDFDQSGEADKASDDAEQSAEAVPSEEEQGVQESGTKPEGLWVGSESNNKEKYTLFIHDKNENEYTQLEIALYQDCLQRTPSAVYEAVANNEWLYRRRNDENYTSFLLMNRNDTGRDMLTGWNYESKSGRRIALSEISADPDALIAFILSECSEEARQYAVSTESGDPFVWTLEYDGMTAYFADDLGQIETIRVLFARHQEWFRDSVREVPEYYSFEVSDLIGSISYDADGDGTPEQIGFSFIAGSTGGQVKVAVNDREADTEYTHWVWSQRFTIVHTPAHEMLYVRLDGDDNAVCNFVYELTSGTPVRSTETEVFESVELNLSDPLENVMAEGGEANLMFGLHEMTSIMQIGENGLPERKSRTFRFDQPVTLTFKSDTEAILLDGSSEVCTVVISEGSTCEPYETDDESYVDLKLDDGRIVRLECTKTDSSTYLINQMPVRDVFDGLRHTA